jgi:hypothetical protein
VAGLTLVLALSVAMEGVGIAVFAGVVILADPFGFWWMV